MSRVRVASAPLWQVQLWKSALVEKGIAAEVTGEALGALTGALPIGTELPVLHVDEADLERARSVIREVNEQHAQPARAPARSAAKRAPPTLRAAGTAVHRSSRRRSLPRSRSTRRRRRTHGAAVRR